MKTLWQRIWMGLKGHKEPTGSAEWRYEGVSWYKSTDGAHRLFLPRPWGDTEACIMPVGGWWNHQEHGYSYFCTVVSRAHYNAQQEPSVNSSCITMPFAKLEEAIEWCHMAIPEVETYE